MKHKRYKSKIFAAIHETATGLYESGMISPAHMREYDKSCLGRIGRREFYAHPRIVKAIRYARDNESGITESLHCDRCKREIQISEKYVGILHKDGTSEVLCEVCEKPAPMEGK